jgi:hypothetical protein
MPYYQLSVAIALVASAACSLGLLVFKNLREGAIQLPITREEVTDDPFDISVHEDVINGYPIEEGEFWEKVCIQRVSHDILRRSF